MITCVLKTNLAVSWFRICQLLPNNIIIIQIKQIYFLHVAKYMNISIDIIDIDPVHAFNDKDLAGLQGKCVDCIKQDNFIRETSITHCIIHKYGLSRLQF